MWSISGVFFCFQIYQDKILAVNSVLDYATVCHAKLTVQFVEYEVSRVVSRDIIKVVSQIF